MSLAFRGIEELGWPGFAPAAALTYMLGAMHGGDMSRPQEVFDFITKHQPEPVCNKCIARGLGWANDSAHPAQITGAFGVTSNSFKRSELVRSARATSR